MIINNNHFPYLIRAFLYHITCNMRYIFFTKNISNEYCINVIFEFEPNDLEIELLIDICGELDGDLYFKNTSYKYLISKNGFLTEIIDENIPYYLFYARNEDSENS